MEPNKNLLLWDSVSETNPRHTKPFQRGGGFSGTAINSTYLIQRATEMWGPMGGAWAVEIVDEKYVDGAPLVSYTTKTGDGVTAEQPVVIGHEKIHTVRIALTYPLPDGGSGRVLHFGQTTFVGVNKRGFFTDEEAPKKSLTDAIGKALSMLGFSADIYLGMFDDQKYVNDRLAQVEEEERKAASIAEAKSKIKPKADAKDITAAKAKLGAAVNLDELRAAYMGLPEEVRQLVTKHAKAIAASMKGELQ